MSKAKEVTAICAWCEHRSVRDWLPYCLARPLPYTLDPIRGWRDYPGNHIIFGRGKDEEAYPYCGNINEDGKCKLFAQKKVVAAKEHPRTLLQKFADWMSA